MSSEPDGPMRVHQLRGERHEDKTVDQFGLMALLIVALLPMAGCQNQGSKKVTEGAKEMAEGAKEMAEDAAEATGEAVEAGKEAVGDAADAAQRDGRRGR